MHTTAAPEKRQLWDWGGELSSSTVSTYCTAFTLPSNGILSLASDQIITLTENVIFRPQCTGIYDPSSDYTTTGSDALGDNLFDASTTPQTYVISAATVIAWVLVIMLIISPRTSYAGSSAGAPTLASGRGLIGGANGGSSSIVGVGSRPWLQKAATLTVAVALTMATADTFKVAKQDYLSAWIDANAMRQMVENSLEIRITRIISDIFVLLAQVQTLIRLFPRHKEKVLIKWIGFFLIVLDTIFACLDSFLIDNNHRPRDFVDAIPALSYLFQLALGLLYAAWVIYYALTKRRYAFYHSKMKNICVIALLSLVAIMVPVVFFVTDVTIPDVADWGDYLRWVGAAAASVVVWEWVERIEFLERDEKKDGILGREIFDGDEMIDMSTSDAITYTRRRKDGYHQRRNNDGDGCNASSATRLKSLGLSAVAQRFGYRRDTSNVQQVPTHLPMGRAHSAVGREKLITFGELPQPSMDFPSRSSARSQTRPFSTPNRNDTTSAASTIYVVRHNAIADAPQPVRRREDMQDEKATQARRPSVPDEATAKTSAWSAVSNPFKRKRSTPPAEVRAAIDAANEKTPAAPKTAFSRAGNRASNSIFRDARGRIGALSASGRDRMRAMTESKQDETDLPWTIIPAQPRGAAAWSPANGQTDLGREASISSALDVEHVRQRQPRTGGQDGDGSEEGHSSTGQSGSTTAVESSGNEQRSSRSLEGTSGPPGRIDGGDLSEHHDDG